MVKLNVIIDVPEGNNCEGCSYLESDFNICELFKRDVGRVQENDLYHHMKLGKCRAHEINQ